jgi:drug/metabolite transporter (DMT)-like permease
VPDRPSPHLAGIGLMLLATLMFSLNDVLGKWLVATYSVTQILFLRSIAALLILAPFIWRAGAATFRAAPQPWLQVLRAALATFEVACFYLSVWFLPLADAMTFYLAGPIYVTAMSALFLGEKVGLHRWSAVLVGFIGVVIALAPTSGSFLAFGAAGSAFTWVPVESVPHYLLLLLLGGVSIVAIILVNQSLRLAPASVVVPYQYSLIIFAILFGYLFFGDIPEHASNGS